MLRDWGLCVSVRVRVMFGLGFRFGWGKDDGSGRRREGLEKGRVGSRCSCSVLCKHTLAGVHRYISTATHRT